MDKKEFAQIIAALRSNYNNLAVQSQTSFDLWFSMLNDIDYTVCMNAVKKIIMQSKFPPTVAEIREAALEVSGVSQLSVEDSLSLINKAVGKYGRTRSTEALEMIKQEDKNTYKVIKAIGFTNYCLADPNFSRNTVIKLLEQASKKEKNNLLLDKGFASEISKIKMNGLKMIGTDV